MSLDREALLNSEILIVDDTEFNRVVLQEILSASGFKNFTMAENGEEALDKLREKTPDLIVLDIMMPKMNGFDFCKSVRAVPEYQQIPILVQTAIANPEQKFKVFEVGASDLVNKPINAKEFISRVFVHLERGHLIKDLQRYRERVEADLASARQMQDMLMPKTEVAERIEAEHNIKVFTHLETCTEMGGDFWGTSTSLFEKVDFFVVDFSGHGVAAALNTFRMHATMQELAGLAYEAGEYMGILNKRLKTTLSGGRFATMFYGIIDSKKNEISYATAASPDAILISPRLKEPVFISGEGFPLGINMNAVYETKKIEFMPGDAVMICSDALIEATNDKGELFGEKKLGELLKEYCAKIHGKQADCQQFMDNLLSEFRKFSSGPLEDDLTINIYYRKPLS